MFRRILLFSLTNILIIATLTILFKLLGLDYWASARGYDLTGLLIFCCLWGFGGAFISLLLSKTIAKWSMRVQVIKETETHPELREVYEIVKRLSHAAKLPKMPEVGIYESPDLNAFATGPSKGNSLVAVSSGLLQRMNKRELEGVLGHEIAHIANGDMVTMTLLQGVVNVFVMFFARIIANVVSSSVRGEMQHIVHFATVIILEIALGLLGMLVIAYYSRGREYRADRGGANLAGTQSMVEALRALQRNYHPELIQENAVSSLQISGKSKGLMAFLATHPPLEKRITKLLEPDRAAA